MWSRLRALGFQSCGSTETLVCRRYVLIRIETSCGKPPKDKILLAVPVIQGPAHALRQDNGAPCGLGFARGFGLARGRQGGAQQLPAFGPPTLALLPAFSTPILQHFAGPCLGPAASGNACLNMSPWQARPEQSWLQCASCSPCPVCSEECHQCFRQTQEVWSTKCFPT